MTIKFLPIRRMCLAHYVLTLSLGLLLPSLAIAQANNCANAGVVTCGTSLTGQTTVGATNDVFPTCNTNGTLATDAPNVWYTLVGTGQAVTVSLCASTSFDSEIGIFSGSCGSLVCVSGNDIDSCGSSDEAVTFISVVGTNYFIMVQGHGGATGTFTLDVTCAAPPADPCAAPIETIACESPKSVSLTGSGASWNVNACGFSTLGAEKVFSFTPTVTGIHTLQVTATSGSFIDYFFKEASSGCSSSGWTCIDDISTPISATFGPLTAGTTYLILLDDENTNNSTATFQINCPPPPFDPCAAPIETIACESPTSVSLTDGGAGWSPNSCGFSTPGAEKVFSFTPSVTGIHTLQVTATNGSFIDYFFKEASGGCSSSGWTCIDDISTPISATFGPLTAGTTYLILLDDETTANSTATFQINCPPPPFDPCTAPIETIACENPTSVSLTGGGGGWSPNSCGFSTPGAEKVFSFTPTVTGIHTLHVTATNSSFIDYFFKEASSGCSSSGWTCIDDVNIATSTNFGPLTAGTTYLILLDDEDPGNSTATFQINCPPACPTFSGAPGNVSIVNGTCSDLCEPVGASISAPVTGCPAGSTIQYSVENGAWSNSLPTYAEVSLGDTITTRCICDADPLVTSPVSSGVAVGACTDATPPTITCPATQTVQANAMGDYTLADFTGLGDADDNCTDPPTVTQLPLVGTTLGVGQHTISLTATDGATNTATCSFTLIVQTVVGGQVVWEHNLSTPVNAATVTLSGDDTGSGMTDGAGNYAIQTNGGNLTVTPTKNDNPRQGVTAADVARIKQHALGSLLFNDGYKVIAADVNESNSVTNADATIIQQALLGNAGAGNLLDNPAWRFVDSAHVFATPNAPWGFPAAISLTNVVAAVTGASFVGVKMGDVNGTWGAPPALTAQPAIWLVADENLEAGSTHRVAFALGEDLDDVAAWQFALRLDPAYATVSRITPKGVLPLTREDFGTDNLLDGELRTVFAQAEGQPLKAGAVVFELELTVRRSALLSDVLTLDNNILDGRVYNTALKGGAVKLAFAPVRDKPGLPTVPTYAEAAFELYQNIPNPFADETVIAFSLPVDAAAIVTIHDANGRVVAQLFGDYAAGYNTVRLTRDVLKGASGVLTYNVTAGTYTATRRMVVVK